MGQYTDIAFIVLNYNCSHLTIKCVNQLISFKKDYHVVIVDNNSPDQSYDVLKEYYCDSDVDVINSGMNKGYGAGNNCGIQFAVQKYDIKYFAVINPDVIIPNSTVFETLVKTIRDNPAYAVVGGSVIEGNKRHNPASSAWAIPSKSDFILSRSLFFKNKTSCAISWMCDDAKTAEVDCIAGCFFLGAVEAFRKISFFDEDIFMYNEEILLGYRLKQFGYKEVLCLDQFYYHNHEKRPAPTIHNYLPARKRRFHSDVILYKKIYSGWLGLSIMYLLETVNRIVLFPWFALRPIWSKEE